MTNTRSITHHSAEETRQLELLRQHRKAHRQKNELTTALAVVLALRRSPLPDPG